MVFNLLIPIATAQEINDTCPVNSVMGLIPPTVDQTLPLLTPVAALERTRLKPVPHSHVPFVVTSPLPDAALVSIIGRTDNSYGEWFYVQFIGSVEDGRSTQYGFIERNMVQFTGNYESIPIINIETCNSSESYFTEWATVPVHQFVTLNLPSDWIYFDFMDAVRDERSWDKLRPFVNQMSSLSENFSITHLYVAGLDVDKITIENNRRYAILYIGSWEARSTHDENNAELTEMWNVLAGNMSLGDFDRVSALIDNVSGVTVFRGIFKRGNVFSPNELDQYGMGANENAIFINMALFRVNKNYYWVYVTGPQTSQITVQKTILDSLCIVNVTDTSCYQ